MGSCDYDDFCTLWPIPSPCPHEYKENKIPCSCPLNEGSYNMPPASILNTGKTPIPSWLENGHYKIKIWVDNAKDEQLFCIQLNLALKAAK